MIGSTVPKGIDVQWVEPATWWSKDARWPAVSVRGYAGGEEIPYHFIDTRLLSQPVGIMIIQSVQNV